MGLVITKEGRAQHETTRMGDDPDNFHKEVRENSERLSRLKQENKKGARHMRKGVKDQFSYCPSAEVEDTKLEVASNRE